MTIKDYLNEYLVQGDNITDTDIESWAVSVPGKGHITVEYNPEVDRADIAHETISRRVDYYVAVNLTELKDTIEYCVGPIVTDSQWHINQSVDSFDDEQNDF
jgi:hypothetical protein